MLTGKIPIGGQMDTMADPGTYANNSGVCGMQIHIMCADQEPPPPQEAGNFPGKDEEEDDEKLLLLGGAGIGYSVGFFLTVGFMYFYGYFGTMKVSNLLRKRRA